MKMLAKKPNVSQFSAETRLNYFYVTAKLNQLDWGFGLEDWNLVLRIENWD